MLMLLIRLKHLISARTRAIERRREEQRRVTKDKQWHQLTTPHVYK